MLQRNIWGAYYSGTDRSWPAQRDVADHPTPTRMLSAAAPLLGDSVSSLLYESALDGQVFAAPREVDSDNPSYRLFGRKVPGTAKRSSHIA